MKVGKRLILALWAIPWVSVTTMLMKYSEDAYMWLVGAIVGMFVAGQTLTDIKGKSGEHNGNSH